MKKVLTVILIVALVLTGLRIYLPYWVTGYVNRVLDDVPGYHGSIEDVDLHLFRGAYQIEGLNMVKTGEDIPVPFLDIPLIDLSVQWSALFRGKIVGEIKLFEPELNFAAGSTGSQTGSEADWTTPIKELMPLQINRFLIEDGVITYKDFGSNPEVDLRLDSLQMEATNLRNVEGRKGTLPSSITLTAKSIGRGFLDISCDANIVKDVPDFDLSAKFEGVQMTALNDFTEAYAKLDFEGGTFNLYTEMAASDGILEGYVKPVMTDLKVFDLKEDSKEPLRALWEGIAGFITTIFKNQRRDQFATQVPFEGDLNNPDTKIWPTIGGILRNAFIKGFSKDVENSVSFDEIVNSSE
ncbi:DUF748 domain-containing protein [Rhodohalobacter sp. 614A]|uniref:DUF748 domain-containing protein n=1 Tax=Rhodohalobacter sp. 614A TaxID=2908649 RepID=UPI001F446C04|nr:DUF748 domain-containing protein [Rhodohalobacter sp. 614A]